MKKKIENQKVNQNYHCQINYNKINKISEIYKIKAASHLRITIQCQEFRLKS